MGTTWGSADRDQFKTEAAAEIPTQDSIPVVFNLQLG